MTCWLPLVPPIVLLGPPGAGKSTVGARVAAALGFSFIDLDDVVGVHHLVQEGLPSFRVREHLALTEALEGGAVVVAAGAGIVDTAPSRAILVRALCVNIDVDVDTALHRLRSVATAPRPWLGDEPAPQRTNWLQREDQRPGFRHQLARGVVDGRGALDVVVKAVLALVFSSGIGCTEEDDVDDALELGHGFVIADAAVAARLQRCDLVVDVGAGKGLAQVERILGALSSAGRDKDDEVVGVGGGTLLDLVGLAAGLFRRGTRWRAVPTTLLAMVDAALGGKTAVDVVVDGALVRNAAGLFHPPSSSCVWPGFLATLSPAGRRHGQAEMLKHQLLFDGAAGPAPDVDAFSLRRNRGIKRFVVDRDPRERHFRQALNLGHTFAHAFESRFGVAHGDAVLHGLSCMLRLSVDVAGLDAPLAAVWQRAIDALQAPPLPALTADDRAGLLAAMHRDKKGAGRFVLLRGAGRPVVAVVDDVVVAAALPRE